VFTHDGKLRELLDELASKPEIRAALDALAGEGDGNADHDELQAEMFAAERELQAAEADEKAARKRRREWEFKRNAAFDALTKAKREAPTGEVMASDLR